MAMQAVRFAVLMEDGTEHPEVKTNLADQVRYDRERIKRRWPPMQENQMTFAAFCAYSAMSRQALFEGTFEEFLNSVSAVDEVDDDEDGEVDPTQPDQPSGF